MKDPHKMNKDQLIAYVGHLKNMIRQLQDELKKTSK